MKCRECGRSDIPLFRQNEKGVPGVWACEAHTKKNVDPVVKEIMTMIERKGKTVH